MFCALNPEVLGILLNCENIAAPLTPLPLRIGTTASSKMACNRPNISLVTVTPLSGVPLA